MGLPDPDKLIGTYRAQVRAELAELDEVLQHTRCRKDPAKVYAETCQHQRTMLHDLVEMLEIHEGILAPLIRKVSTLQTEINSLQAQIKARHSGGIINMHYCGT